MTGFQIYALYIAPLVLLAIGGVVTWYFTRQAKSDRRAS